MNVPINDDELDNLIKLLRENDPAVVRFLRRRIADTMEALKQERKILRGRSDGEQVAYRER